LLLIKQELSFYPTKLSTGKLSSH